MNDNFFFDWKTLYDLPDHCFLTLAKPEPAARMLSRRQPPKEAMICEMSGGESNEVILGMCADRGGDYAVSMTMRSTKWVSCAW